MSKFVWACLVVTAGACSPAQIMPPMLGDYDGSPAPPTGGGPPPGVDGGFLGDAGVTVLAPASNPKAVFVSGGQVYFTSWGSGAGDGAVSVAPVAGGAGADLATNLSGPWALTVVNTTVFFTLVPPSGPGGMSSVPTTGGAVTPIDMSVLDAVGIASDGTNVFYTALTSGLAIESVPVAGGTPKQQFDMPGDIQPVGLTLSGTDLYVATTGTQAAVLHTSTTSGNLEPLDAQTTITFGDVLASTTVVYATVDDIMPNGQILAYPRGPGAPTTVATGLNHPQRLALDGNNLYFTDPAGGNVWVKDVTTTDAPTVYVSGLSAPLPIAVADALYVGVSDGILRIAKL